MHSADLIVEEEVLEVSLEVGGAHLLAKSGITLVMAWCTRQFESTPHRPAVAASRPY